jgi:hypothetical protein
MYEEERQMPRTLYDKVLQAHIVDEKPDGSALIYIGTYLLNLGLN